MAKPISGLQSVVSQLRKEKTNLVHQLRHVDAALSVLGKLNGARFYTHPRHRKMSVAARARIAASQKARWAKVKGQRKVVSIAPKHRRISPAGLARIRAATKARWLQPDEQMWIDVGRLIRERVPDQSGKTLPVDLTSGAYEFRDLTNPGNGTLFEGKVIYDKTYGHVTYGCGGPCCDDNPYVQFNPLGVPFLGNAGQGIDVPDNCGGLF